MYDPDTQNDHGIIFNILMNTGKKIVNYLTLLKAKAHLPIVFRK